MQVFVKLLSGRVLTLEVDGGTATERVLEMVEELDSSLVAREQWLLASDPERRLLPGECLAEADVRMEAELRLVPRQRPAPHPTHTRRKRATERLLAAQAALAQEWDELHDRMAGLDAKKRAVASRQACAAANAASWFESRSRSFAGTFLKYSSRHESQAS